MERSLEITQVEGLLRVRFRAMANNCEILFETSNQDVALELGTLAVREAARIEQKYSRYLPDSVVSAINMQAGSAQQVDSETSRLLDFAAHCHALSGGLFDITSGALRRAWRFDGSDHIPDPEKIRSLCSLVGWHRVAWQAPQLMLPTGMEIDLGGLGKEYAVDRTLEILMENSTPPVLVNYGGDLRVSGPRSDGRRWQVGLENPLDDGAAAALLGLKNGALATSGDAHRFVERDGRRYGHVLDPRTGWPVQGAPRSVTVLAETCLQAGLLATLTLLQGAGAEEFLRTHGVRAWAVR